MAGSTTFDYAGESAVVTGSTKGIGRGIAAGLVAADANVVVNARTDADVADAVAELDELGAGEVTGVTADMADPADIERLVESAIDAFGEIDLLVNNAAVWPREDSPVEGTLEDRDLAMDVNVRARLRRVVGHDRMLGVRMHACLEYADCPTELDRTADWILDDELAPVWDEAGSLDTSVFVFPKADQLSMVEELVAAHPRLSLVVDHMAFPDETTAPAESPWDAFETLTDYDDVAAKVSSVPRSSDQEWPYEDVHSYLRNLPA